MPEVGILSPVLAQVSGRGTAYQASALLPRQSSYRQTYIAFPFRCSPDPDCRAAETLLAALPPRALVMADRAYDTDASRRQIEDQGAVPNIPSKTTRRWKCCFSPVLYRARNAVERMFCRLKDYRRIATRYDKLGANFLAAVYIVASVTCWL